MTNSGNLMVSRVSNIALLEFLKNFRNNGPIPILLALEDFIAVTGTIVEELAL
jgi:hypothetical protein